MRDIGVKALAVRNAIDRLQSESTDPARAVLIRAAQHLTDDQRARLYDLIQSQVLAGLGATSWDALVTDQSRKLREYRALLQEAREHLDDAALAAKIELALKR